jgi:E3 ubiquitin-protein ligase TRIP12
VSSYTVEERRAFLQLYVPPARLLRRELTESITGAPKLPIGGFRGLTPPFTVVRKPHEPPFKADDYLPSVMTCAQVCLFLLSPFPYSILPIPTEHSSLSIDIETHKNTTDVQYLKMPDYTTREILLAQLDRAIKDGGQSFHLS